MFSLPIAKIHEKRPEEISELIYQIYKMRIGTVLIAAEQEGFVAVYLGEISEIRMDLSRSFPCANIQEKDSDLLRYARNALVSIIDCSELNDIREIPIVLTGTVFQNNVLKALVNIPYGKTVSYKELARAADAPHAVRAVATAVGNNHIALLVPCHRVILSDGSAGEYRWGADLKRDLLTREKQNQ